MCSSRWPAWSGRPRGLTWENLARAWSAVYFAWHSEEVDEFGYDPKFTRDDPALLRVPLHDVVARRGRRAWTTCPREGPALIVANHSGVLPWDGLMINLAVRHEHPARRPCRMLALDMFALLPFLAPLLAQSGAVRANQENGERLLRKGELVGVFPEGVKGVGKPFKDRYRLARFGRGGFVRLALRTGAPIVPCAVVGAEEIHPKIASMDWLGRPFGLPYLPITPTFPLLGLLGVVPAAHEVVDRLRGSDPDGALRSGGRGRSHPGQPALRAGPLDRPAHGRRPARAPPLGLVRLILTVKEVVMSKTHAVSAALVLAAAATAVLSPNPPASPPSAGLKSYTRAREVLDRALEASGGRRAPGGEGRHAHGQRDGLQPGSEPAADRIRISTRTVEMMSVADFAQGRSVNETVTTPIGGLSTKTRAVLQGDSGFGHNLLTNVVTPSTPAGLGASRTALRRDPLSILVTASRRADTLRYLGEDTVDGEKNDVITFADADGTQITLYVSARTGLLTEIRDARRQRGAGRHGDGDGAVRLSAGRRACRCRSAW